MQVRGGSGKQCELLVFVLWRCEIRKAWNSTGRHRDVVDPRKQRFFMNVQQVRNAALLNGKRQKWVMQVALVVLVVQRVAVPAKKQCAEAIAQHLHCRPHLELEGMLLRHSGFTDAAEKFQSSLPARRGVTGI